MRSNGGGGDETKERCYGEEVGGRKEGKRGEQEKTEKGGERETERGGMTRHGRHGPVLLGRGYVE